jgi:serine/threonine-protein kinase Chk2
VKRNMVHPPRPSSLHAMPRSSSSSSGASPLTLLPPQSPESPDVNAKKPRRSQRNKGGPTEDKNEEKVTTPGASKEELKEEALPNPQEHATHTPAPSPPTRTPASSPPPHTQDATQAASQFYYPPLADEGLDKKEVDESVWGYLWPLSDKSDSVIKLNKQAPIPDKKKKKKGPITKGKKPPPNGFLVGRHAECDLLIDDAVISNRHCVIFKVFLLYWHTRKLRC